MIFDSWGGVLADGAFQQFSLAYTAQTLAQIKRTNAQGHTIARIVFTKSGGLWLPEMAAALPCDALGLDWTMNLAAIRNPASSTSRYRGYAPCTRWPGGTCLCR